MRSSILFVSLLLVAYSLAQLPTDACSLCTSLVDGLESYSSLHSPKTRDNLLKGLETLEQEVCAKIPASNPYFTSQQCSDYIDLYGSYLVDLFLSSTAPSSICGSLGLCSVQPDEDKYQVIMPTISNSTVEYDFPFTQLAAEQKMMFKLFLANPEFVHEDVLFVQLKRQSLSACALSMEITNKTNFNNKVVCGQNTTACRCNEIIPKPGRGVWYYITIANEQVLDASQQCSFSLHATVESNTVFFQMRVFHVSILSILLPFLICCFCFCCCCALRRRCRRGGCRRGGCRFSRRCGQTQTVSETESGIAMQNMAGSAVNVDPNVTPMGYYYVPAVPAGPGYVPVPMTEQSFAYPQFVAVQQE
jgi:hypothetical protein